MVDLVEDLPLSEPSIATDAKVARPNPAQGKGEAAKIFSLEFSIIIDHLYAPGQHLIIPINLVPLHSKEWKQSTVAASFFVVTIHQGREMARCPQGRCGPR
jgi:hypothetical protein